MAVGTLVSVAEYLNTSYRPDCDYVDGEVRERNLGEIDHSGTQMMIGNWLMMRYIDLVWRVLAQQRVQAKPDHSEFPTFACWPTVQRAKSSSEYRLASALRFFPKTTG